MSAACPRPTLKVDRRRSTDGATGTRTTFMPDQTIFEETDFQFETLEQRFREMAFLNRGLTIEFCDERTDNGARWMSFYFEGGVRSFVRYLNKNREVLHEPIYVEKEIEGNMVEAAIQYNDGYNESVFAFANTINTPDGGTHLTGLRAALTRTINDWAKRQNLLKEADANFTGDDTREGLTAIISVKLPDPQFESQTKVKLLNNEIQNQVESAVAEALTEWLEKNPQRRQEDRREVHHLQPGTRGRAQGARPGDPQERAGEPDAARQAGRLLGARPGQVRAVHRRGRLRRRLAPSRAATAASRRSCRCAARSSTSRRPGSTSRWRTRRSRRWCRRSAAASATGSTWPSCAITAS